MASLAADLADTSSVARRERLIYWLHFHKSGGTSVCTAAQKNDEVVPNDGNCNFAWVKGLDSPVHGAGEVASAKESAPPTKSYFPMATVRQQVAYMRSVNVTFLGNEVALPSELPARKDAILATMLRDPMERAYSHYRFNEGIGNDRNTSLHYWLAHTPDNWITRQLCGLECWSIRHGHLNDSHLEVAHRHLRQFELVGALEDWSGAAQRMSNAFGWKMKSLLNTAKRSSSKWRSGALTAMDLDPADFQRLEEANRLDLELVRRGCLTFKLNCSANVMRQRPNPSGETPAAESNCADACCGECAKIGSWMCGALMAIGAVARCPERDRPSSSEATLPSAAALNGSIGNGSVLLAARALMR